MAKIKKIIFLSVIIISSLCFTQCKNSENQNQTTPVTLDQTVENTYKFLDTLLVERKQNLLNYIKNIQNLAKQARQDSVLISFFNIKSQYFNLKQKQNLPESINIEIQKLRENIQTHYLRNYLNFYDILFIQSNGDIFYTIRKEADYHKNIFNDEFMNSELSKKLLGNKKESLIDFEFYRFSGEPSAFFIEPVESENKIIGWMVLQLSINKINSMFSSNYAPNKTGEIFLVNKEHYLLTNSRFKPGQTTLRLKLPAENIDAKFKEKKGRKEVIDYRNRKVLSVFEVFNFMESEWLIISKIDKAEIITNYYLKNKDKLYDILIDGILSQKRITSENIEFKDSIIKVYMDEFKRISNSSTITTKGVATCTAVDISMPGNFSYLAHVSPYDKIYNQNKTDLIGVTLKQISYFDITESEKFNLEFNIISKETNALNNLVYSIIEKGYFLNQIKISINPDADYGGLTNNPLQKTTVASWRINNPEPHYVYENFDSIITLEDILVQKLKN